MPFKFKPNKRVAGDGLASHQTNDEKADDGQECVNTFVERDRFGRENDDNTAHVGDLIAALGHLCDRERLDFDSILQTGRLHWQSER